LSWISLKKKRRFTFLHVPIKQDSLKLPEHEFGNSSIRYIEDIHFQNPHSFERECFHWGALKINEFKVSVVAFGRTVRTEYSPVDLTLPRFSSGVKSAFLINMLWKRRGKLQKWPTLSMCFCWYNCVCCWTPFTGCLMLSFWRRRPTYIMQIQYPL